MLAVHRRDDNISTEKRTHPFCALTKDISEEERAGITGHFGVLTWKKGSKRSYSRSNPAAIQDVFPGDRAEVGDIG